MYSNLTSRKIIISLFLIIFMTIVMNIYTKTDNKQDIRSKAQTSGTTFNVCPNNTQEPGGCTYLGGDGIQKAIEDATPGTIIQLQNGEYKTDKFVPLAGKVAECYLNTQGKTLTIRGVGFNSILHGENKWGEEYQRPSELRAGICDQNGNITLDSIHIKQTRAEAINFFGTRAIIKNVWTDDIDTVPVTFRGGSQVIVVNSFINGPMNIDDSSRAIVINNTFCGGGVNLNLCKNNSQKAIVINNIFSLTDVGVSGGKCGSQPPKLSESKISNNLIWRNKGKTGCDGNEICDFPGKVEGDPLYESFPGECAYGDVGIVEWAFNYHLKDGSPGKGAGDASIASEVGMFGGPCTDANSSGCNSFITSQLEQLNPPASPTLPVPTVDLSNPSPSNHNPTSYNIPPTLPPNPQPNISDQPPISYYLPPTIPNSTPSNQGNNIPQPSSDHQTAVEITPIFTPTPQPTRAPIFDMKKTVINARNSLKIFISKVIIFTQNILP